MQTQWSSALNPIIAQPLNNGLLLQQVGLLIGSNMVNHRLGRKLQGWILTRVRAPATIYDLQDTNQQNTLTLILVSNAIVMVDLFVF
jgi:hypothetical protein